MMNATQIDVNRKPHDKRHEWRVVILLTLGFGLVGLDRWIIAPLFPEVMRDLHLNYQDIGNLIGALGITWGICAILAGGLSDRFGRRIVLVPAIIGFSLLSGISGLATGLTSLLALRALMGVTEGSFCPTSFAATADVSRPSRLGFNLGLQQSAFPLLGLALGPILATQLLKVVSWRWVFFIVAIPGLIVGYLIWKLVRDPPTAGVGAAVRRAPLSQLLSHRNVPIGMLALLCAMSGIFVLSAMVPSYLVDFLKLTSEQMGFITSAIGFGGFLGQIVLPGASDFFGRKAVSLAGFGVGAAFLYFFSRAPADPVILFALLFACTFFCFGLLGLITGPIAAEAAPAGLISSTAGLIIGTGEIFGGGVAPSIAGAIAQRFGIQHTLSLALGGLLLGLIVCVFLKETAPER